jgi:hypothetical protein
MPSPTHIPRIAVSEPFWKGLGIAAVLSTPIWAVIAWVVRRALS